MPVAPDAEGLEARLGLRRSVRNIAGYVGISIGLALLFLVVLATTIAGAVRDTQPSIALFWQPADAQARANQAALILSMDRSESARARARALAEDALQQDASSAVAYRSLGVVAEADGRARDALRMYLESQRMSRRDQPTQLWFVTQYYQRDDPEGMIRHFDIALRTTRRGRDTLLPLLANFSGNPRIVPSLQRLLASGPPWAREFAAILVQTGPRSDTVVELLNGRLDPRVAEDRPIIQRLLERLAGNGEYALAWSVYSNLGGRPAAPGQSALLRDGGFEAPEGFPPFDWAITDDPDLAAYREGRPDSRGGNLLRLVARVRSGTVARQMLRLSQGSYLFRAEAGDIPASAYDRPRFMIACAQPPSTALLDQRPTRAARAATAVQGGFAVPANCPWQWLSVEIAGDNAEREVDPWIDNLAIAARR